ncbi:cytochrome c [Phenylobacterium sp.]|uniref:c-type cytochrome n=1 Tax=Phenylobacterium sp. TaxID=1871053 RepID=UPI00273382B9|nr:cytochrome c [Phenylobacterium sp.]MDP3855257.1 cytochrome c [Phenylobacterium sp.]
MRRTLALALALAGLCAQPAAAVDGQRLYQEACAACHRPNGAGIPGAFPTLAKSKFVQGDPKEPIGRVLHGRGGMPSFQNDLTDADIAAVLTYVRAAWGNAGKPVTPAQVKVLRGLKRETPKAGILAH